MSVTSIRASDLKVAGFVNPIGIDDRQPSLSWRISEPAGAFQAAYQILVASSKDQLGAGKGDLWDSGKVESGSSVGVRYDGTALGSRDRCFWQVTVWDQSGRKSEICETATWEMGLLDTSDWSGEWLAAESEMARSQRALTPGWFGDVESPAQFRCTIEASEKSELLLLVQSDGLILSVSCDGVVTEAPVWNEHAFGSPPAMTFAFALEPGEHEFIVKCLRHPNPLFKPNIALAGQYSLKNGAGKTSCQSIDQWETSVGDSGEWTPAARVTGRPFIALPPSGARLLRNEFALVGAPRAARLYVAALGGYEIVLNGIRVGSDELQSEPTEYRDFIPYRSYDVTALVQTGANAIGATVADGFYASYTAPEGRYMFGPPPRRIRLMLAIEQQDGTTDWIVTDKDWRSDASEITGSEIYNGEDVDYRLAQDGWDQPGFDDSHWERCWTAPDPEGLLVSPISPPIRATECFPAIAIDSRGNGRHVIDFGQNFAGRIKVRTSGKPDQEIIVRHAETLGADGELDVRNLRAAAATDRYILRDAGEVTLEPRFVYHGFRYAEISGIEQLSLSDLEAVVLTSSLEEIGTFDIAEPMIQRLWLNTMWSQRSNFVGIPTDCPQRDERLGWTGDAQIFWDTAAYNMDVAGFTRSFAREMRAAQRSSGAFPVWAPMARLKHPILEQPTPGWADAGVELPYVSFLHSGDRQIVDENWEAMERYMQGVLANNSDYIWRNGRGADFGDHLSLDSVAFGPPTTPQDLIGTAMLARNASRLAQMAEWTGRTAQAAHWREELAKYQAAFATEYIGTDGFVGNGSHTSYILALRCGVVPNAQRAAVGAKLAKAIRERGTLLTTGFLGTPLALDALADIGETELAYALLLRTEYPSWGYMVDKGATTIWERWNGDVGDVSMNSYNHYALGAVCAFLYRRVCGIEPLAPGFARVRIAPLPDHRIPSARAVIDSVAGPIVSGWKQEGSGIEFAISVPPNVRAEIALPGRITADVAGFAYNAATNATTGEVGPGDYAFTVAS